MNKTKLTELVDTLYKLRMTRKQIDDQIKELEKPFKELLKDGDTVKGQVVEVTMNHTTRTICPPSKLYPLVELTDFFGCVNVLNKKAEDKLGPEAFLDLCDTVPYQKLLNFVAIESK